MIGKGRWVVAGDEKFDCQRNNSKKNQRRTLLMWSQEGSMFDGTCTTFDDDDYWTCYAHADGDMTCRRCPHYKGECAMGGKEDDPIMTYNNRGSLSTLPPMGYLTGRTVVVAEPKTATHVHREHKVFSQSELAENIYKLPSAQGNLAKAFKFVPSMNEVIDMYGVGRIDIKGYDKTIFPYINKNGQCTALKCVQYEDNGHRSRFISQLKSFDGTVDESLDYRYTCMFGEHLVSGCGSAKVCIVESEKTALLGQAWAINNGLDLLFLATGGGDCLKLNIGNLNRIAQTHGVYLFADNDNHWDIWRKMADDNGWHFSDWRTKARKDGVEVNEKDDFGDYVARYYWDNN